MNVMLDASIIDGIRSVLCTHLADLLELID